MKNENRFIYVLVDFSLTPSSLKEDSTAKVIPRIMYAAWERGIAEEFKEWVFNQNPSIAVKEALERC